MNWKVQDAVYLLIVEQTTDAVIFADREGLIRIWNRGAEAVFGFTGDEACGKSLDIIIPEELRKPHWEGYKRAIETGRTRLGGRALVTRGLHRDGSRIYVDLSVAVLVDDTGQSLGSLAVGRNVTERYLADRALKKRLAELENRGKPSE